VSEHHYQMMQRPLTQAFGEPTLKPQPATGERHVTSRWHPPLFVWTAATPELDPEEADRIRDALASIARAVLPPGAAVEYLVPLVPRTFRPRTALGLVRAM
jgi:hypothetical protein